MSAAPTVALAPTAGSDELRDAVRELLEARDATVRDVLGRSDGGEWGEAAWQGLATELGVAGIAVSEDAGGAGAGWIEAAVIAEELGRVVGDVPFVTSSGIASALLSAVGAEADLRALAEGTVYAVVTSWAQPISAHPGLIRTADTVTFDVPLVAGAIGAHVLILPAADRILAIDVTEARSRVAVAPVASLDMTRQLADVSFRDAPARELAVGAVATAALERAGRIGLVLLAAEQVGIAAAVLELAIDYVKVRHQFGRPIGSFQAVKHRLADLWTEILSARAVAAHAASCAEADSSDLAVAAALAKVVCSRAAQHAAEEGVQLHGGIGFTWEHPAHLYLKRARADEIALGPVALHRHLLGDLVDL
jgi:alkylation response protein AidB-like acyl-CoA dehydrogenase